MEPQQYDCVALDGGAEKVVSYLGALQAFPADPFETARVVVGVSAGALLGMLLCLRLPFAEVKRAVCRFAGGETRRHEFVDVWTHLGLVDADAIVGGIVRDILTETIGSPDCTFAEFNEYTGYDFRVVASDLTDSKPVVFDVHRCPAESVARSIAMSAAIPVLFQPVRHDDGHMYVDGGAYSPALSRTFVNSVSTHARPVGRTLVLRAVVDPIPVAQDGDFAQYVLHLVAGILHQKNSAGGHPDAEEDVVSIPFDVSSTLVHVCTSCDVETVFSFLKMRPAQVHALIEHGFVHGARAIARVAAA
jgi:hypothetical protein